MKFFFSFLRESTYATQAVTEIKILLPLLSECWVVCLCYHTLIYRLYADVDFA